MDFTAETKYTFEEFKRFNKAIARQTLYLNIIFHSLITIISLVLIIRGSVLLGASILFFWVIFYFLLMKLTDLTMKKTYESSELIKNTVNTYHFTDDLFEITSSYGQSAIPYDKICQLLENDTNFYIMIQRNMGYILSKDGLTSEQQSFIREKCKGKKG